MNKNKIAVYAPYVGKNNVGDEFFVDAYKELFPEYDFKFFDKFKSDLSLFDGVFFGGGSFLDAEPLISEECLKQLETLPVFYIGVGSETNIHPIHQKIMSKANLLATRNKDISKCLTLNKNTIYCPDIVFSIPTDIRPRHLNKKILIIPNGSLIPRPKDELWKRTSWNYFKCQLAQWIDSLQLEGYSTHYLAMCENNDIDDRAAAFEIISDLERRRYSNVLKIEKDFNSITEVIQNYDLIITQRYHGIVLAESCKVPYIAIHHHDKLKTAYPNSGYYLDYYGASKNDFQEKFNLALTMKRENFLPIETNIFTTLKERVEECLTRQLKIK